MNDSLKNKSGSATNQNTQKFYKAAIHIAHRLTKSAIWHEERCTWTGDDIDWVNDDWNVVHQTMDGYLYSGSAGIARFLVHCWELNRDEHFKKTAIGAIQYTLNVTQINVAKNKESPLGLYDGLTGIAMIASDIGTRVQDPGLLKAVEHMLSDIHKKTNSGKLSDMTDMTSGYAGIIIGLLKLADTTNNSDLFPLCQILVDKLLSQARQTNYGSYWNQISQPDTNTGLCGYGHGASGIAHALLEFYRVSGNDTYLDAAKDAMRYERSWYNSVKRNWPDIRDLSSEQGSLKQEEMGYSVYWCHGAAGVGLARLRAYQLTGDKTCLAEASAALQTATSHVSRLIKKSNETRRLSIDANLSVCHGLGSVIDLFIYAYQVLGSKEHLKRARDIGTFGLKISKGRREYWRCGIADGGETPGHMIGMAGIGYNFLRLYDPTGYAPAGMEISFY